MNNPRSRFLPTLFRQRTWIQLVSTLLSNNWFTRFATKGLPCPGMNCYACPLAATACPIGSIQHFIVLKQVPWYVLGFLGLIGALGGRVACGWLCPFGWIQDLFYKIPLFKWQIKPRPRAKWWILGLATLLYGLGLFFFRGLSLSAPVLFALYLIFGLLLYVYLGASRAFSLLGIAIVVVWITGETWFCKICPTGMLQGGIPQVLLDASLRSMIGPLYVLKLITLVLFILWMIVTRRPFCRWLCPLGALWSPLNRVSTLQMMVDDQACIRCNRCQQVCPVDIRIYEDANAGACIRCMQCVDVCPVSCIELLGQ